MEKCAKEAKIICQFKGEVLIIENFTIVSPQIIVECYSGKTHECFS